MFDNERIIHVDGTVDPVRDKEIIDIELQMKDSIQLIKELIKLKDKPKLEKIQQKKSLMFLKKL